MTALVLARALQGLGGGGLMALAQTIIADIVSPRERGRYQGYIGAVFAVSSVGGPVLGGFLTEHLDWSLIFWINLPLGLAALGMTSNVLKRVPFHPRKHALDVIGARADDGGGGGAAAGAVVGRAALRLDLAADRRTACAARRVLWGLFAWRLMAAAEPFLPLAVLGNPVVRCAALAGACTMATLVGMTIFVPLYFEVVLHLSAGQSGLALIPLMGATVMLSTVTGRADDARGALQAHAADRRCRSRILALARAGDLAGLVADRAGAGAVGVIGAGLGTVFPISTVCMQNAVTQQRRWASPPAPPISSARCFRRWWWRSSAPSCSAASAAAPAWRWRRWRARPRSHALAHAFRFVFLACALVLTFGMAFLIAHGRAAAARAGRARRRRARRARRRRRSRTNAFDRNQCARPPGG